MGWPGDLEISRGSRGVAGAAAHAARGAQATAASAVRELSPGFHLRWRGRGGHDVRCRRGGGGSESRRGRGDHPRRRQPARRRVQHGGTTFSAPAPRDSNANAPAARSRSTSASCRKASGRRYRQIFRRRAPNTASASSERRWKPVNDREATQPSGCCLPCEHAAESSRSRTSRFGPASRVLGWARLVRMDAEAGWPSAFVSVAG